VKRPQRPQVGPIGSQTAVLRRLDASNQAVDGFFGRIPYLNGQMLQFSTTGEQSVLMSHGMTRPPQGFIVICHDQDAIDPTKTNWKVWVY
jgi:hypothetical protein